LTGGAGFSSSSDSSSSSSSSLSGFTSLTAGVVFLDVVVLVVDGGGFF